MTYQIRPAHTVTDSPPTWLWPGRIPRGGITLLEGEPGCGKSSVINDLAARISTGRPMPETSARGEPADVLLFSLEDQPARIRRGLTVAGADLHRVHLAEGQVQLPEQLDRLAKDVERSRPAMIVFDPVTAYLGGNLNSDASVRRVLTPLAAMADRMDTAIVLIRHLTKSGASKALYRGAGSIGLIGAARSCLLLARHPAEADQRVLAPVKMNLIRPPQAVSFQLKDVGDGAVVEWMGASELSADQLLVTQGEEGSALTEAMHVLYSVLGEGPVPAGDAMQLLRRNGVADRTGRRAKVVLGVTSRRQGFGPGSRFYWQLPSRDTLVQRLQDHEMTTLLDKLIHGSDDPHGLDRPPQEPGTEDLAGGWKSDDHADE